jgi:transcriptional regulator GlxA family with amidase domain
VEGGRAFLLAAAGLLDGRAATTHWDSAARFRRLFPRVALEADRLFVRDGNIWTSAGVTAGMDLALALVEARFLAETGQPPGRFVARVRLDAARRLLEEGPASVEAVASRAGYGTPEAMRLAFRRRLEVAPRDYRTRFPAIRRAPAMHARTRP